MNKSSLRTGQPDWFAVLVNVDLKGKVLTCGYSKRWTFLPTYHMWKFRHLSSGH